ncbi:MAG: adenosine deaminase [Deltaproteobacteria bacterium]|nr:adenosine deaminase [Deltaproteobacteria bacterium]
MDPLPPLADLHRHLDGSLRPSSVDELAHALGKRVPADLAFSVGLGLEGALARFAFTLSLLQTPDAVRRVARELCEDAASEGVTTLEVRFAPQLHGDLGATLHQVVDAALDGLQGRAGLLLCGLYGEPPAVLRALVDVARTRHGVVGIDLAGAPLPQHRWRLEDYAAAFLEAERAGLGRTVHAAEGRPPGEIRVAVERLHAQRVGHGTTLLDDPSVLELVLARGVTVEAAPTSNVHTVAVPSLDAHPLPRWLDLGVKACVNTDNTLLSGVDAPTEHRRALSIPGMTLEKLQRAIANGHQGAFSRRPTGTPGGPRSPGS